MYSFFNDYFNIRRIFKSKQEYKTLMARVDVLPEDYQYVFKQIQKYMWKFSAGAGYDVMEVHKEIIDLFESGVTSGKGVLEITGDDAATFCEELLRNVKTYTEDWKSEFNNAIHKQLSNRGF